MQIAKETDEPNNARFSAECIEWKILIVSKNLSPKCPPLHTQSDCIACPVDNVESLNESTQWKSLYLLNYCLSSIE